MPIYEYWCAGCKEQVEVWLRTGGDRPVCPHCGEPLQQKLFSASHVMSGTTSRPAGRTCCGQEERCAAPPCAMGNTCPRG